MFDSSFSHTSTSALPSSVSAEAILSLMHDYDLIAHLNPDCVGVRLVEQISPTGAKYSVEDAVASFIPKRLWNGTATYSVHFVTRDDGCDISINAPGGFSSINRWRLLRGEGLLGADGAAVVGGEAEDGKTEGGEAGEQQVLRIASDAKCNMIFAVFVKRAFDTGHVQLHKGFREQVQKRLGA